MKPLSITGMTLLAAAAISLSGWIAGAEPTSSDRIDMLRKLGARLQLDSEKQVVGVNLSERKVGDADLVHLKGLPHLRELDPTRTRITSAGLARLKDLTALKKLYLTDTKVDDSGLGHLKEMKMLELLGLSGTKIGDAGLDQLRDLSGLKQLFCIGTRVTDAGAANLQKALPRCRITR